MINHLIFLLVLTLNFWIWKIFDSNIYLGVIIVLTTLVLYLFSLKQIKLNTLLLIFGIFILCIFQIKLTPKKDLFGFTNDQIRLRDMRLREYPPMRLPVAYWFEQRKEFVVYFRMKENLGEVLDTNLYFFANHPRSRVSVTEIEKFPYLYLPFFVFGVISLSQKKKYLFFLSSLFIPLVVLTIYGNRSLVGPFVLFPFLVVSIFEGINFIFQNLKAWKKLKVI